MSGRKQAAAPPRFQRNEDVERRIHRLTSRIDVLSGAALSSQQRSLLASVGLKYMAIAERSQDGLALGHIHTLIDEAEDVVDRVFLMMLSDDTSIGSAETVN